MPAPRWNSAWRYRGNETNGTAYVWLRGSGRPGAVPAGDGTNHIVAARVADPGSLLARLEAAGIREAPMGDRLRVGFHYSSNVYDVEAILHTLRESLWEPSSAAMPEELSTPPGTGLIAAPRPIRSSAEYWVARVNYDEHGHGYSIHRRPDPRIASRIHAALGDARTVANVGAGTGSYEPSDRYVLAFEPSQVMRGQRSPGLVPAISAHAESLPLDDDSVDAAMAILTVHHWNDPVAGLRQLRRIARGPVAVLTIDVTVLPNYWLVADYVPEVTGIDSRCFPAIELIAESLGEPVSVEPISIPSDCSDGFVEAYWARPEAFLNEDVRAAQATWKSLPPGVESRAVSMLATDLANGDWDRRHGYLRRQSAYDAGLVLVVSRAA